MILSPLRRLSLVFVFCVSSVHAATLANFSFTDGSLSNAEAAIPGITVSVLQSDSSFLSFTSSTGWDSAAQVSGAGNFFSSPTSHSSAQNAVFFTITAATGYTFSLDTLSFLARSTSTAPADIGFKINASNHDYSASYTNNSAITTISNSTLRLTGLTEATVSIQGWNASSSGALQLDNITLTGSVIPEPSTFVLLASGALLLMRRRR